VGKLEENRPLGRPGHKWEYNINPLNAELNPICHLLALLGVHHFLYMSRIRVKMGLQEVGCGVWIVSIWLRIGTAGRHL
jgi:hypothetical protein